MAQQPDNIANGQFLDANIVQSWFNYLLALAEAGQGIGGYIPQYPTAPDFSLINFYYDTTLEKYQLYNYAEATWRGVALF